MPPRAAREPARPRVPVVTGPTLAVVLDGCAGCPIGLSECPQHSQGLVRAFVPFVRRALLSLSASWEDGYNGLLDANYL